MNVEWGAANPGHRRVSTRRKAACKAATEVWTVPVRAAPPGPQPTSWPDTAVEGGYGQDESCLWSLYIFWNTIPCGTGIRACVAVALFATVCGKRRLIRQEQHRQECRCHTELRSEMSNLLRAPNARGLHRAAFFTTWGTDATQYRQECLYYTERPAKKCTNPRGRMNPALCRIACPTRTFR